ncbi:Oidioi.mRNA.OKI2018_I69.PAR.g10690.t1.cds [Oikopleura dioica]|uniref:Oidioi.mRNA.OKI2018_I69.PAR.g10690.t1.cds n=1 Tax=Oikopleura dioica TaxID=34765 RepID=A0ABN7RX44_OIKDI|nr:Oidioi.mRNA.OKI2018_I69.PAR.g10690.t1.cds [Oikopleura dioica]
MHCEAQGILLQTLIHDYFEIVGKIDDTKSRLKNKMTEIGFENASYVDGPPSPRIVRFVAPDCAEELEEQNETIKAIEDIEDKIDEVNFLHNVINLTVHGQGETLDRIEQYAEEGASQLEKGVKKTAKAARQKKYCRILKIALFIVLAPLLNIAHATGHNGCAQSTIIGHNQECNVKCASGYELNSQDWALPAKCKVLDGVDPYWTFSGKYGSGESNKVAEFGCCLKHSLKVGHTLKAWNLNRNFGTPYAEADANFALFNMFVKNNSKWSTAATNGYSFLLVFPNILPADVTVKTFARLEVTDVYRDPRSAKTLVRLNSKPGFESFPLDSKIALMFALESAPGGTNIKDYADNNAISVKFYHERHPCFCAGNTDLCSYLVPPPTKFASFNIQVFGTTKYGKTEVKDQIVQILNRYDIATTQEIRDSSETAFPSLVGDINAVNDIYDWWTGARQGTTSSKEQVGFIWDRNDFSKVDGYDFDDSSTLWFERPPTVLVLERVSVNYEQFQTQKLGIISGHLKPVTGVSDMVTEDEINHLQDVYNDLLVKHPDINDVLIVGDFNADCNYVANPESLTLYTEPSNDWLIPFEADTTVSPTDCAYDHIVLYGNIRNNVVSSGVFDYQTYYDTDQIFYNGDPITDLISDHFPVEFEFF